MDTKEAIDIITRNSECGEGTFMWYMHERDLFSPEKLEEFLEGVAALAGEEKDPAVTRMITDTYQAMLKELIYHFNPDDSCVIEGVPWDYPRWLDKIEYVLSGYYSGDTGVMKDEIYQKL